MAPRALVVDDLPLTRVLLSRILRTCGFVVAEAEDGEEAAGLLEGEAFAVVFLDWSLPGMDGDAVMARIRRRGGRPPPVVSITADDGADMRERCRLAGAAVFLGKELTLERVRSALAELALTPAGGGARRPAGSEELHRVLQTRAGAHLAAERAKFAEAMAQDNVEAMFRALHNLSSLAGMVGAGAIAEAVHRLEVLLRQRESHAAALAELDAELAAFRPAAPGEAEG